MKKKFKAIFLARMIMNLFKSLRYHAAKRVNTIATVGMIIVFSFQGILLCARTGSACLQQAKSSAQPADSLTYIPGMYLKISAEGKTIEAPLLENPTTREFIKRLPLTLMMGDISRREKYAGISPDLPADEQVVKRYAIGDISYWLGGGIAIYYEQDGKEIRAGLVHLAKIKKGIEVFNFDGKSKVLFELVTRSN